MQGDMWDSWAGQEIHSRAKDYTCFKNKLRVYFPVASDPAYDWFEQIRAVINTVFGGSTTYDAEGSWMDKQGELVTEPVKVIEVAHNCHSREEVEAVSTVVRDAALATAQEVMSIEANQFHLIPSGYIQAAGLVLTNEDQW